MKVDIKSLSPDHFISAHPRADDDSDDDMEKPAVESIAPIEKQDSENQEEKHDENKESMNIPIENLLGQEAVFEGPHNKTEMNEDANMVESDDDNDDDEER
jgi:hypothetical protein